MSRRNGNNEISEEAKRALADLPRRRAFDRLNRDGAHSTAAVQRRVRAIAHQRNIPPADYFKLAFCDKQGKLRLAARRRPAGSAQNDPRGRRPRRLK
jgi:hypothetical protein